jgi:hypothetical protein
MRFVEFKTYGYAGKVYVNPERVSHVLHFGDQDYCRIIFGRDDEVTVEGTQKEVVAILEAGQRH